MSILKVNMGNIDKKNQFLGSENQININLKFNILKEKYGKKLLIVCDF